MRISVIKNESFENLGLIEEWASEKNFKLEVFEAYNNQLPEISSFDLLIILGGNASANDNFPWLISEIDFLKQTISNKSLILGICLGAQLLSKCLGGKVLLNSEKEIGWFPLLCPVNFLQNELNVFHWHSETFTIPPGGELLASSEACTNQAFSYDDNILGLQFHLEMNMASIELMLDNVTLNSGTFVQNKEEILERSMEYIDLCRDYLFDLLDGFEMRFSGHF